MMQTEHLPPPIYSQQDPEEVNTDDQSASSPQLLIIPTTDAINFQKGYLGAEGERAAIEGELQIKGTEEGRWGRVTVSLRTVETAYDREIELGFNEVVLFSSVLPNTAVLPSTFPFSIPLTPDTPQSIRTPHSSLSHTLTATLHPLDSLRPLSKTLEVHTRRYSSHSHTLTISPETHTLSEPTHVKVQIPRNTFKAGESVPIYITVPPPRRELVVEQGLRLRNVRVELVRVVKVKREAGEDDASDSDADAPSDNEGYYESEHVSSFDGPSRLTPADYPQTSSSLAKAPVSPLFLGSSFRTVLARSGALCRFHSSRPVQLRFVLRQPTLSGSPSDFQINLPNGDHTNNQSDADCASISQSTVFHSVSFRLNISVSFVDMSSRTERFSIMTIPVAFLAPPAPLPEVAESVDVAYQKKHDRPPTKTVRYDDDNSSIPRYDAGGAGPSGAPPPFEERDAPPPFFSSEASTSTRLPTFLEAETEILIPTNSETLEGIPSSPWPTFPGEGREFGFPASEQFDGHSDDLQSSFTPPPTLEMAEGDPDVSGLIDIREPERAMEALGLALDQHEEAAGRSDLLPPPPPAMDDPSDPPPSIDSDFRSPSTNQQTPPLHPSSPLLHSTYDQSTLPPTVDDPSDPPPSIDSAFRSPSLSGQALPALPSSAPHMQVNDTPLLATPQPSTNIHERPSQEHAPPPYLNPEGGEQENVTRPPPYVDLLHPHP